MNVVTSINQSSARLSMYTGSRRFLYVEKSIKSLKEVFLGHQYVYGRGGGEGAETYNNYSFAK